MSTQQPAISKQSLWKKRQQVDVILKGYGRVVVAFSGGVDSTLLATLAGDVLGKPNVLTATADSPSLARHDLAYACWLAQVLDLEHLVVRTHEVDAPSYRANADTRCYLCKQVLFRELEELAQQRSIPVVLYGAIGDDQVIERPGQRAAIERGVRAPLQEAGLAKWEVREAAKLLGLPNWDRPQNACLSSRIPHGLEVTEAKLKQVEEAEAGLSALGFRQVRVRHLGTHARIEVGKDEVVRLQDASVCRQVLAQFQDLGFRSVGIDLHGYRAGGANTPPVEEIKLEVRRSKFEANENQEKHLL